MLRLITDFDNKPVQHLCEQTGFRLIADVTVFEAEAAVAGPSLPFRPLAPSEADPAFAVAARAHLYRAFERLFCFDHVWKWAELTPQWLARCALGGQAWWWGGARGVIVGDPAPEGDTPLDNLSCLFVCFAGADPDALADLLVDLRSLAGALDKPRVGIPVPLGDPIAQAALDRAGYRRAWTGSLHLYEARQ